MTDHADCRNPVLPPHLHIPDPEAHVMPDGRVYVYGSWDQRDDFFSSGAYRVFSSADLLTWTDHGQSFDATQVPWFGDPDAPTYPGVDWSRPTPFIQRLIANAPADFRIPQVPKNLLFAPDAIHRDGRYYLYFCASDQSEGVAVADRPEGPFRDAVQLPCGGIDPAVFLDDDGQAYYYWGQFHAHGARLQPCMTAFVEGSRVNNLLTEEAHHFHEGSSVRRRGDLYYLVYTSIERGQPNCLSYATATAPLGPFTPRGVLLDNRHCDPKSWNNHGSIECVGGQWYLFYHRSSRRSQQYRRLCIEPIHFDVEGLIAEVPMTSQGAGRPLGLGERIEAWRACELHGAVWIGPEDDAAAGEGTGEALLGWQAGDRALWRYLETAVPATAIEVEAQGSGVVALCIGDALETLVGEVCLRDGVVAASRLDLPAGRHTLGLRVREAEALRLRAVTLRAGLGPAA